MQGEAGDRAQSVEGPLRERVLAPPDVGDAAREQVVEGRAQAGQAVEVEGARLEALGEHLGHELELRVVAGAAEEHRAQVDLGADGPSALELLRSSARQALALDWDQEWSTILEWDLPFAKWFTGGTLNKLESIPGFRARAGIGAARP